MRCSPNVLQALEIAAWWPEWRCLLSFNLGVEIGQLNVVIGCLATAVLVIATHLERESSNGRSPWPSSSIALGWYLWNRVPFGFGRLMPF
jgi:hypothetical protein